MTARQVIQTVAPFTAQTTCAEARARYAEDGALASVAVVSPTGRPIGLVTHARLKLALADANGRSFFSDKPVSYLMDGDPLIVDVETPLSWLQTDLLEARPAAITDGFIIVENGVYAGIGTGLSVLRASARIHEQTEDRLRVAMMVAGAAVWEIDFIGRRVINSEALERVIGRPVSFQQLRTFDWPFVPEEDRLKVRETCMAARKDRWRIHCQHRVIQPDGELAWIEHVGLLRMTADRKVTHAIFVSFDISRRKAVETLFDDLIKRIEATADRSSERLARIRHRLGDIGESEESLRPPDVPKLGPTYDNSRRSLNRLFRVLRDLEVRDRLLSEAFDAAEAANEAKTQFLANVSHELRTPLNAILGYAEILDEDLTAAGMETPANDAQRIRGAARHLLHLINEILDLSKIEAGRMDVAVETFDVSAALTAMIDTVRPLAANNANRLVVDLPEDLGEAVTDAFKLKQCLLNLLSNACKFTKGGEVSLVGRRERVDGADRLVFTVSDTGIGMTEEQTAKLFQPFVQADGLTTHRFGGTGLGLAITRRLARLLGGDVAVSSVQGQGAVFTLWASAALDGRAGGDPDTQDHDRPVALLLIGEAAQREQVRQALRRLGFSISAAANAEDALHASHQRSPAIALIDLDAADQAGWRTLAALKADAATRDCPVIALSRAPDRRAAVGAGACDVLASPIECDVLAASAVRYARFNQVVRETPDAATDRAAGAA
jgi:signal transduction histidine kinase/ActR/RegA family two-component response regulator